MNLWHSVTKEDKGSIGRAVASRRTEAAKTLHVLLVKSAVLITLEAAGNRQRLS